MDLTSELTREKATIEKPISRTVPESDVRAVEERLLIIEKKLDIVLSRLPPPGYIRPNRNQ